MTYHFLIHSIDRKESLLGRLSNYPGIPSLCVFKANPDSNLLLGTRMIKEIYNVRNLSAGIGGHFLYICTILGVDENQIDG